MPSSQGYQKVASDPSEAELVQRTAAGEEMPSMQQPDTAVTANPAGKIPATNSQQRLMPGDSDSVSSSLDEGDPEAPPGGGRLEDDEVTVASSTQVSATAWFTVGVLCFVNLINYMDRFTIAGEWMFWLIICSMFRGVERKTVLFMFWEACVESECTSRTYEKQMD